MQIFVLGMHRSGTSAVTRILNLAGAYFAPEGISNGADEGNPKGFWERLDVRRVCDGLLQGADFDWWRLADFSIDAIPPEVRDRQLSEFRNILLDLDAHRPWVVKEPRLSVLLPLVRPLLEVPVCVHVSREPLEVAESLRVRNGIPISVGLALWELYTIHSVQASAGLPRLLVRYEDLMAEPSRTVATLIADLTDLGVRGLHVPSDQEIGAFLTADLHRQRRSKEQRPVWLTQRQAALAVPLDEGRIPDEVELGHVSEGAQDALRSFQLLQDQQREALQLLQDQQRRALQLLQDQQRRAATEASALLRAAEEAAQASDRAAQLEAAERARERALQAERADRGAASLGRAADSVVRAERQVRLIAGSRRWRALHRAVQIRRRLISREKAVRDPLDKVIVELARARDHLSVPPTDSSAPGASS